MTEYLATFNNRIIVSTAPYIVAAAEGMERAVSCTTIHQAEAEREKLTAELKRDKAEPPQDKAVIYGISQGQWGVVELVIKPSKRPSH